MRSWRDVIMAVALIGLVAFGLFALLQCVVSRELAATAAVAFGVWFVWFAWRTS